MVNQILNGRYRLEQQYGAGGMSVVYRAFDPLLGRMVAIKILRPSLTGDESFLARFRSEARNVANLNHPNIVTVYDVGQEGEAHYIVMEFIDGKDLKKLIKENGALPADRALNIAIQICKGIGFAHRSGLVHADVKPQNVLLAAQTPQSKGDIVKVTDFGIAQAFSGQTQPGERQAVVWGSPHYFAPEQARGEKPSPASDVYAIGVVLFEMLTGKLPYNGANQQELALAHLNAPIPRVTDVNPSIPEALVEIVYKTMSKEPMQRYSMAGQLESVLETYQSQSRPRPPLTSGSTRGTVLPSPAPTMTAPTLPTPAPPMSPTVPSAIPPMTYPSPAQAQYPPRQFSSAGEPLPTQRVDLAPNAPGGYTPYPPANPSPYGMNPSGGTSQYYPSQSQPIDPRDLPSAFDAITIALAALAFFAVACLIPLYVAVFQARLTGF